MATVDVTVMGAGVFGLSVAWACLQRGARVRVVDRAGVAAGSSGGIVGALAPHVPENWNDKKEFQFQSLLMAQSFWADIETVSGQSPGYARLGRRQAIADDKALAFALTRQQSAAELWRGKAEWRVIDAPDWAPQSATGKVIEDTLSARLHPKQACEALAAAIRVQGGEIAIADSVRPEGQVVWATGVAGLDEMSSGRARPVGNGVKGQAVLLDYDARDAPQLFAAGLHIVPHGDGTLAIGSTSERAYDRAAETDAQCDILLARAIELCRALASAAVLKRWAGVRPRARTRAPMLGPWPDRPGHFVANGGFKIGFGMAPKVAEVIADLLLEGRDGIPAAFRVEASF